MDNLEGTDPRPRVGRRSVLGAGLAGTAAAALAACTSDGDAEGGDGGPAAAPDEPASSAAPTTAAPTTSAPPLPDDLPGELFAAGVASGDPLADSVVLWTRLVADPLDPTGGLPDVAVPVRWEVATDDAFEEVVAEGTESAEPRWAHSVHALAGGLDPDAWYWYRFVVGDAVSDAARTRTMPADDATPDQLKLAVASCQEFNSGSYAAYAALAADQPDLVLFLGDYIYERGGGRMEPKVPIDETVTLSDYRVQYAAYKRNPLLQAAHRVAPWVVTWDDHEVANNYAGVHGPDGVPEADFAERRSAAYQAYWEHMPLRGGPPGDDGSLRLYRSVKAGTLAEFFVLDGRQYRSDQPCGDRLAVPVAECAERDDEDRTMLGDAQEQWLAEGLRDTGVTWPVIAQQTVVLPLLLGDLVLNPDQWDGYTAARQRLLDTIVDAELPNAVVLSGDIHAAGAATHTAKRAGEDVTVAHEFVCTSISSVSVIAALGDAAVQVVEEVAADAVYFDAELHGYCRMTLTPERWQTQFVVVDSVDNDDEPARVDATVLLESGGRQLVRS